MKVHQQPALPPPSSLAGADLDGFFPPGAVELNSPTTKNLKDRVSASLNATTYLLNTYEIRTPTPVDSTDDPFSQPAQAGKATHTAVMSASNASSSQKRKICFITVGATAPFDELVEAVQKPRFLATLQSAGYTNLLIQHGHKGRQEVPKQIGKVKVTSFDFRNDNITREMLLARGDPRMVKAQVKAKANAKDVDVQGLDLGDAWEAADWDEGVVISHAGSGSILDALRVSAPLIVVPNQRLLDNHQMELAEELARQGYVVHGHLNKLGDAIEEVESKRKRRKQWPPATDRKLDPSGKGLIGIMDSEMGYTDLKGAAGARPQGLHLD